MMRSTKLVFAHTNKDNNDDNELHHLCNKNKKIKNKNKRGIMSFKFVTPFTKTRKQKGQQQARRQTHLRQEKGSLSMALGNGMNSFKTLTTCITKKREALRILKILWRWVPCNKIIKNTKTKKTIKNTTMTKGYRPEGPKRSKGGGTIGDQQWRDLLNYYASKRCAIRYMIYKWTVPPISHLCLRINLSPMKS
jgi:hypothetical protein